MRLYLAHYHEITCKNDILVFFAKDQYEAIHFIRMKQLPEIKDYLMELGSNDMEALIDEFEHERDIAIRLLKKRNFDKLASLFWDSVFLDIWTIEERFVPRKEEIFACMPEDVMSLEEVHTVSVPIDTYDVEGYVYSELDERIDDRYFSLKDYDIWKVDVAMVALNNLNRACEKICTVDSEIDEY